MPESERVLWIFFRLFAIKFNKVFCYKGFAAGGVDVDSLLLLLVDFAARKRY